MPAQDAIIKHFDNAAATYRLNYEGNTIVSHSFNSRLKIILSLMGDVNNKDILDIGCGPGILARSFLQNTCNFTGVDISEKMIEECIKDSRLSRFSFTAKDPIVFFEESRKSKFHIIVCIGLFEYLTDGYANRLLKEISEHLYPGGVFIATYPNICSPYRLADRFYRRLISKEIMVPPYTPGVIHREFFERSVKKKWMAYHLEMDRAVYYNFRLIVKPIDNKLQSLDLFIAQRLQFLEESCFRFLATAMVLRGRKRC